jgi:trimeric autotransporter adhesin
MKKHSISIFLLLLISFVSHAQIITTVAGTGIATYNGDGIPATAANMLGPKGITVDKYGNVYICSSGDYRIRKVSITGIITTFAGNGTPGFSGDGGMASNAQISLPNGIALDNDDNLYICDSYNNRIRKVNTAGIISTVVGNGDKGYSGDGGQATEAKIWSPFTVTVDNDGNIYFVDNGNNRVRKVRTDGVITTIAGIGGAGYNGDNIAATAAMLNRPTGIARDNFGDIYVCDNANKRIRKIDNSGTITTVAGVGTSGYSGDNGPATDAKITSPMFLIFDNGNNMYFSDLNVNTLRKVSESGIITTIAGTPGLSGYSGDGGAATAARMAGPNGLAFSQFGGLYVADFANKRVRQISNVVAVPALPAFKTSIHIYPNPSAGQFAINVPSSLNEAVRIVITDIAGHKVHDIEAVSNEVLQINMDVPNGIYFMQVFLRDHQFFKEIQIAR